MRTPVAFFRNYVSQKFTPSEKYDKGMEFEIKVRVDPICFDVTAACWAHENTLYTRESIYIEQCKGK